MKKNMSKKFIAGMATIAVLSGPITANAVSVSNLYSNSNALVSQISSEKGELQLDLNFMGTPIGYNAASMVGNIKFIAKVNEAMERVEFTVIDGTTKDEIGFIEEIDARGMQVGMKYNLHVYDGKYNPIVNGKVAYEKKTLEQGYYKIRMTGTDKNGNTHIISEQPLYVDNTLPELRDLKLETHKGRVDVDKFTVYEYDEELDKTLGLSGTVYDPELQIMKDLGIDPFSRKSQPNYYKLQLTPFRSHNVGVDKEGNISGTFSVAGVNSIYVTASGIDGTGNTSILAPKDMYLVKKGMPYVSITPQDVKINVNDDVKATFEVKNMENAKELNFSLRIQSKIAKLTEMKLLPEFEGKATIEYDIKEENENFDIVTGKIIFNEPFSCMESSVKIAEATLKHSTDIWYRNFNSLFGDFFYIDAEGTSKMVEDLGFQYQRIENQVQVNLPSFYGEGISRQTPSGIMVSTLPKDFDYKNSNINMYARDKDGKIFESKYDELSERYQILLPCEGKDYTIVYDIPGHFTLNKEISINRLDEMEVPYFYNVFPNFAPAGDVNKDNVIDIKDAVLVIDYIKNPTGRVPEGVDVNLDGKVNNFDVEHINRNFGMVNPTVEEALEPQLEHEGKSIHEMIKSLELEVTNLTDESTVALGKEALVKFNVNNVSKTSKKVSLLVGIFDSNDRLVGSTIVEKEIAQNTNEDIEAKIQLPGSGDYRVKAVLWDGLKEMSPYIRSITYMAK